MTFSIGEFSIHRRLIHFSLSLYLIATWSSMAGMEIFGWLTFLLVVTYAAKRPADAPAPMGEIVRDGLPWKAMIGIVAVTALGIFVNGQPQADKVEIIGSQRWVFLLCTHTYALFLAPVRLKGYKLFLFFASVIAVYAIFQSFTGIDLLRMNDALPNRAVQPLDVRKEIRLWRSAGLFGSPMGYVYIAGMHACLMLACAMLFPKGRLRAFSIAAFSIVALSLVTTHVRGAWFAMAVAYLAMAWLASRRYFYIAVGTGAAAFVALFAGFVQFRERFLSLFNMSYGSNSDRLGLWAMNWRIFLDYPIFGIGWEENETRACEYVNCLAVPKPFTGHAHNNYLQVLAGMGILGLAAYLAFIGFFLWLTYRLWKQIPRELYWARALTLGAMGAQIYLHVGGLTECNFKAGATNHNFMVVLAVVASLSFMEKKGLLNKAYGATFENDNAAR